MRSPVPFPIPVCEILRSFPKSECKVSISIRPSYLPGGSELPNAATPLLSSRREKKKDRKRGGAQWIG